MELVLFIGIQATGKSSFYKERFYRTHVRVNYDMLKTRHREELLVNACIEGKTKFVVDNTNLTRQERARHIVPAKSAGFTVVGFFFQSRVADALRRNSERQGKERVPNVGIFTASSRLEQPSKAEGFDQLFFVQLNEPDGFMVEEWKEPAQP
jgi:predicted kinase